MCLSCHRTDGGTSGSDPDERTRHSGVNQGDPRWRRWVRSRTVHRMTNLETEQAPLPPPTPATPHSDRRWARSDDRVVLGVAGGLARALAIDPLFVRITFVVLALFSGAGIILYIAGFALLAASPTSPPPTTVRRIGGAIAILLCARWLFRGEARLPGAGWVVAIGLLGAAVALWRGRTPIDHQAAPTVEVLTATDGGATSERWDSWTTQRRNRPRPPRSALGMLTIGAATVVGALAWLLNGAGNRGSLAFGWATVVLGAGLLTGAVVGRARWLIVPALATAAAAVAASALSFAGTGLANGSGGRSEYIGPGSAVAAEYRTGLGDFDLVLSDYPSDLSTAVEVGVGDLTVIVPDNARVQIDARVGLGSIDALGSTRSGYRRTLSVDNQTDGSHVIKLKLRVGVGDIEVRRGTFSDRPFITVPTILPAPDIPAAQFFGDGTVLYSDGSIDFGDGRRIEADGSHQIMIVEQRADGSVQLDNGAVIHADGTVVSPGGFVIGQQDAPAPASTVLELSSQPTTSSVPATATTEVQP
jgi:phage shock protein PspC (stress-responsive transcriptional regulator)